MPFSALASRRRSRREKVFGPAPGVPLDRNAKARIMMYVRAYNARMREKGQHTGPVTRASMDVLRALLYSFHNGKDGRCFPGYERIAKAASCCRATVSQAIRALETAGVLTWVHRLGKIRVAERDLFGQVAYRWRVIRTSNAYRFCDPVSGKGSPSGRESKNQPRPTNQENKNHTDHMNQESSSAGEAPSPARIVVLDPNDDLDSVLIRLGKAAGADMETSGERPE